jgi:hypothetical protein
VLVVVTVSILGDDIISIDTLLPVPMVGLLCVAARQRCGSNERNESDLDTFGLFRHLSDGGNDEAAIPPFSI